MHTCAYRRCAASSALASSRGVAQQLRRRSRRPGRTGGRTATASPSRRALLWFRGAFQRLAANDIDPPFARPQLLRSTFRGSAFPLFPSKGARARARYSVSSRITFRDSRLAKVRDLGAASAANQHARRECGGRGAGPIGAAAAILGGIELSSRAPRIRRPHGVSSLPSAASRRLP